MGTFKKNLSVAILQNNIDLKYVFLLKHFWNYQHLKNNFGVIGRQNTMIHMRQSTIVHLLPVIMETDLFLHFNQFIAILCVDIQ